MLVVMQFRLDIVIVLGMFSQMFWVDGFLLVLQLHYYYLLVLLVSLQLMLPVILHLLIETLLNRWSLK